MASFGVISHHVSVPYHIVLEAAFLWSFDHVGEPRHVKLYCHGPMSTRYGTYLHHSPVGADKPGLWNENEQEAWELVYVTNV